MCERVLNGNTNYVAGYVYQGSPDLDRDILIT
jgi:hypothetical protein